MSGLGILVSLSLLGFLITWGLTYLLRRHALLNQWLDHPGARSSHTVPTPRGGGVAFVLSFVFGVIALWSESIIEESLCIAIIGSGLGVTLLGLADDRRSLPAKWRFLGHLGGACWVLWCLGELPPVPIFGFDAHLGFAGPVIAAAYIVWSINLFNFMDGIDGIASIEAITVALGGALVWWLAGAGLQWYVTVVFAFCVGGFLVWNFPPARIFMGDAGSGFLGLVIASFALWCGRDTPNLFWSWFILAGVFMVDATTTLVRRVRRGDKFHEAHRSHAYQYASRRHGSHKRVSLAVGLINLVWLLPIAVLVALGWADGVVGVFIAYVPLVWLAFRYKAGDRAGQGAQA